MPRQGLIRAIAVLATALAVVATASAIYGKKSDMSSPYFTESVRRADLVRYVRATGEVIPRTVTEVSTEISGKIIEVNTDINQRVTRGQILALVDPYSYRQKLQQAKSDLAAAEAAQALAESEEQRLGGLLANGIGTKQRYEQAVAQRKQAAAVTRNRASLVINAEEQLARCTIKSLADGIVIGKAINVGETVQASYQPPMLFAIAADLTKMRIEVPIKEIDISSVHEGQEVEFTVVAIPGRTFSGRVVEIRSPYTPKENQQQQVSQVQQSSMPTFIVVIDVENDDLALRRKYTAKVAIVVGKKTSVLLVPNSALRVKESLATAAGEVQDDLLLELPQQTKQQGQRTSVVYRFPNNDSTKTPEPVVVELGFTDNLSTEVISGLNQGDLIATGISAVQETRGFLGLF